MEMENLSAGTSVRPQTDSEDPRIEVVYDAMNIEEMDHFDIGTTVGHSEISSMDVSVWSNTSDGRRRLPSTRRGSRVVNVNKPARFQYRKPIQKLFDALSPEEYIEDDENIVVDSPSTSKDVSRVFISSDDPLQHLDWRLFSAQAEPFAHCAQLIVSEAAMVDSSKICIDVPQEFTRIGTFIIALHNYHNRHEITIDGLGPRAWGPPQNSSKYFCLDATGKAVVCANGTPDAMRIICNRYVHTGTDQRGTFIKKTYTGIHSNGSPSLFGILVYDWEGTPHPISIASPAGATVVVKERAVGSRSWDASGKTLDLEFDDGATFRNQPIFNKLALDFEAVCRVLLATFHIPGSRICTRVPYLFRDCATFVLDVKACGGERILGKDGREWNKPSGSSRYFRFDDDGKANRVECHVAPPQSDYDVQITCKRYETIQCPGLLRKLYMAREVSLDEPRVNNHLAVLVYSLKPMNSKVTVAGGRQVMVGGEGDPGMNEEYQGNMPVKPFQEFISQSASNYVPAAKRHVPDMGVQVDINGTYVDLVELKRMTLDKQLNNQTRMSRLLDRAEAVFHRIEQVGITAAPMVREVIGSWRNEAPVESVQH